MSRFMLTVCLDARCLVVLHSNAHKCHHCGTLTLRGLNALRRREERAS